jgi:phytoene synthase
MINQPVADLRGDAYATANASLARHGRSFHWARRLLGATHARRATILYGFCRRVDDLADGENVGDRAGKLDRLALAIAIGQSADPLVVETIELLRACRIDPAIPLQLIRGVESDLGVVRVPDHEALLQYCYRVAGTVGLMMSAALDAHDLAAMPYAIDLGIAMQLTNICRDVSADAVEGRRYLPATLVGELDPAQLVCPEPSLRPVVRAAVSELLDLADKYYASGEQGLAYLPAGARAGILVAARVYREIGMKLRRRDCDCWSGRVRVPAGRKLLVSASALAAISLRPNLLHPTRPHDPLLHDLLGQLPHAHAHAGGGRRHAC